MFHAARTALAPVWVRLLAAAALAVAAFLTGWVYGARDAGQEHIDYLTAQAAQTQRIALAQAKVVHQVDIQYRDRIRTIYVQGEQVEKRITEYLPVEVADQCVVPVGFVRLHDAAWTGDDPGPAAESDAESSAVSLADVAGAEAHNATSCRAWREQALGLRALYQRLQGVTNEGAP